MGLAGRRQVPDRSIGKERHADDSRCSVGVMTHHRQAPVARPEGVFDHGAKTLSPACVSTETPSFSR